MSTILLVVILILIFGGGGGYYAHGRYGAPVSAASSASFLLCLSYYGSWAGRQTALPESCSAAPRSRSAPEWRGARPPFEGRERVKSIGTSVELDSFPYVVVIVVVAFRLWADSETRIAASAPSVWGVDLELRYVGFGTAA